MRCGGRAVLPLPRALPVRSGAAGGRRGRPRGRAARPGAVSGGAACACPREGARVGRGAGRGGGVSARGAGAAGGAERALHGSGSRRDLSRGAGRDSGRRPARGPGRPERPGRHGRARARLRASRASRCELGEGFRVGWPGRVEFASRLLGAPARVHPPGPRRRVRPWLSVTEGGVRPRSLGSVRSVPACVQDLRDRVNALHTPPQGPACAAPWGGGSDSGQGNEGHWKWFYTFPCPVPFSSRLLGLFGCRG